MRGASKCKRPPGEEIRWAPQFSVDGRGGGMPLQLTCDAGGGASQEIAAREEDCCDQTDVAQGGGRAGRYSQIRRNGPGRRRGPSSPNRKMGEEDHLSKTPAGGRRNRQGVYQGRCGTGRRIVRQASLISWVQSVALRATFEISPREMPRSASSRVLRRESSR